MKKLLLLAFLGLVARPLLATVHIVTSIQDFSSIADSVGGKRVETFALSRGYQDPHFVEPKPSFILKLSRADLLVVAGLELEIGYLPPLLDQSRNEKIRPGAAGSSRCGSDREAAEDIRSPAPTRPRPGDRPARA